MTGFGKTCIVEWSNYTRFIKQLTRCFIAVRIDALQSSLLYDRQQKERESVDDYAQDLRKLFYKAYQQTLQGTTDIEKISKSVLCNQFVAGLLEGNFDTLLTKARIKEVKF